MSEKLAATVILYTARPKGLLHGLKSLVDQNFWEFWQLVIVDSLCLERQELVADFVTSRNKWIELTHVPPLDPLPTRPWRHCWDIPLFMNTGWAHAKGEIVVQLEDFMTVEDTWLANHVAFARQHKNLVAMGHVVDESGVGHYNRKPPEELQAEWVKEIPALKHQFDHPDVYRSTTDQLTSLWLSGNTSFWLEHVFKFNGAFECPTHWPETTLAPFFMQIGLSMWPLEGVQATHYRHAPGMISDHVMRLVGPYADCISDPVIMQSMNEVTQLDLSPNYKRDLVALRKEMGLWT